MNDPVNRIASLLETVPRRTSNYCERKAADSKRLPVTKKLDSSFIFLVTAEGIYEKVGKAWVRAG